MKPRTETLIPYELKLRFFDLDVILRSDSPGYIDLFGKMYARFKDNGHTKPPQNRAEFVVLCAAENPWGQPVLLLDNEVWPLHNAASQQGYVYDSVLRSIMARVRSHFLIHAGVAAYNGQGVILAADAFHGKTTLTMELVRRGFKFLSDELAAVGRADGQVHPFPRSLRIRPHTLALTGFSPLGENAPTWLGKLLLDIEQIQPDSMGDIAQISHVIILQNPAAPVDEAIPGVQRELSVLVNRLDDALLTAVAGLDGVQAVQPDVERGYPTLRLQTTQRMAVLAQIEALCHEHRVLIVDVSKRAETRPGFDNPARLEPISKRQAIIELLRRFQGGHQSAILQQEFGGSSTRLFLELTALLHRAKCHRLFVGPLHQSADLICQLVGASKHYRDN